MKKNFTDDLLLIFKLFIIVIISRLALFFVGYIGMNTFPMYDMIRNKTIINSSVMNMEGGIGGTRYLKSTDFNKFDSGFYLKIANEGYPKINMTQSNSPTTISFFPLYPILVRAMRWLHTGRSDLINSLILSNVLLVFALFFIYKLCENRGFNKTESYMVLILILCYPSSIFYSLPYTESLFLCLSAGTIYYSLKQDYLKASIFAALSAITRFPGFINITYIFFMMLSEKELSDKPTEQAKKISICMTISLIPITSYFSYMRYLTGDFLAPLHDVSNWGRALSLPFKSYVDYIIHPYFFSSGAWNNGVISFAIATVVLIAFIYYTLANFKKLKVQDWILLLYGFLIIVIPFSNTGSVLVSIPRYLMVSIPMYFYIIELYRDREFLFSGYFFLFAVLNALMTIGFFNGYYFVV